MPTDSAGPVSRTVVDTGRTQEAIMEPLLIILIPGLLGGLVLAFLIARNRRSTPPTFVPRRLEAPSPSLINMAHIKIEGLGGLGLVAAVIAVAIADPRIRLAIIIAFVLGAGLALALIAARRRTGSLPSGGDDHDDRSMLHLDANTSHAPLGDVRAAIDKAKRMRAQRTIHQHQSLA
jgi:hypothetical protein